MQPSKESPKPRGNKRSNPDQKRNATFPCDAMQIDQDGDDNPNANSPPPESSSMSVARSATSEINEDFMLTGAAKIFVDSNIEAIGIETIRASNAQGAQLKGLVAVFVGGTGGIGEATLRELFLRTTAPRAYVIGRNREKGDQIVKDIKNINPHGEATFICKDISLLRSVDELCEVLKRKEERINCLFISAGYMTLKGRNETDEGLDRKMSVNYYSRIRWTLNLMPLLTAAADAGELSRVITVLAAGSEGDIKLDDLDLRHNFSLHACLAHCVVLTDFMIEELAKRYPATAFSHSYPGTVKTGIANELTGPVRLAVKVLYAVMTPWILNVRESGERHFFQMTSKCYPAARSGRGIEVPPGLRVVRGSDGQIGSGAYLLDWDGKTTGDESYLKKFRDIDFGRTTWEHTMSMFQQAEQRNRSSPGKRGPEDSPEGSRRGAPNPPLDNPIGWRSG